MGTGLLSLFGILTAWWFWWGANARRATALREFQPRMAAVLENKFYFDEAYQWAIDNLVLRVGAMIAWFDRHIVNDTGINGPGETLRYASFWTKFHVTGTHPGLRLADDRRHRERGRARIPVALSAAARADLVRRRGRERVLADPA